MITFYLLELLRDDRGQDLIEYALLAALVSTSIGVVMPGWIFPEVSQIMSKVTAALVAASSAS